MYTGSAKWKRAVEEATKTRKMKFKWEIMTAYSHVKKKKASNRFTIS